MVAPGSDPISINAKMYLTMITQKLIAFKIKKSTLDELNDYCAANNLRRNAVLNDIVETYLQGVSGAVGKK